MNEMIHLNAGLARLDRSVVESSTPHSVCCHVCEQCRHALNYGLWPIAYPKGGILVSAELDLLEAV